MNQYVCGMCGGGGNEMKCVSYFAQNKVNRKQRKQSSSQWGDQRFSAEPGYNIHPDFAAL